MATDRKTALGAIETLHVPCWNINTTGVAFVQNARGLLLARPWSAMSLTNVNLHLRKPSIAVLSSPDRQTCEAAMVLLAVLLKNETP